MYVGLMDNIGSIIDLIEPKPEPKPEPIFDLSILNPIPVARWIICIVEYMVITSLLINETSKEDFSLS